MPTDNVKTLKTRIALKYDSYTSWTTSPGKDLILLKGEIGICEIPNTDPGKSEATTAPTVLFKIGDGEKKFSELNWASAKAADVFNWAKAQTVEYNTADKKIYFKDAKNTTVHSIDLTSLATVATTDGLEARITNLESSIGGGDGSGGTSLSGQISALGARLDIIEGESDGSIKKAAADTLASAKAYTDEKTADIDTIKTDISDLETTVNGHTASIAANDAAIKKNAADIIAGDQAIKNIIGGSYSATNTVHAAIEGAKTAINNVSNALTALETGQVTANKDDIATLNSGLAAEKTAREAIGKRLEPIEAFFVAADKDSGSAEAGDLHEALDTLKEIQDYITTDGAAAAEMVSNISANAEAISSLQATVSTGENSLTSRMDAAEADITAAESSIENLNKITKGYTTEGSIQTAVNAAKAQADKGVTAAAAAQSTANAANSAVQELTSVVNNGTTGLAATKTIADDAASRVSAIEADYMKNADFLATSFIFNCGSASEVTHVASENTSTDNSATT